MVSRTVTITLDTGLHARPASQFVSFTSNYKSDVTLKNNDRTANAKSILSVLILSISKGTEIQICVDGEDEENALAEICDYLENLKEY